MEKEWVGIQFNLIDDTNIKLRPSLEAMGIETDGSHVSINFSRKELKKMDIKKQSEKLRIAIAIIKKHLTNSDYTNIYTRFDANKLRNIKEDLQQGIFKDERIRVEEIRDKKNFINNFSHLITHQSVLNLVKKHPLMKFMNELLKEVTARDYALEQELALSLGYEDKEDWDADRDNLEISIQLEIPSIT